MNIKILISCHKDAKCIRSEVFEPIQVGTSLKGHARIPDMLYDNAGDNISDKNPEYCELTAQYWAWKNLDADYYGFCHYRRYFSFADQQYKEDGYGNIIEQYLDERTIEQYALNDVAVQRCVQDADIIVTPRQDIRKMPVKGNTPTEHYKAAQMLHYRDFETMLEIIDDLFPDYSETAHTFVEGSTACFCNMYMMRREYFHRYCAWMFAILDEFCKRTDMSHYSTEARRTPGHLSERLLNIWLMHEEHENPNLRVKELQCVMFQNTENWPETLQPAYTENSVPVVFAANDGYAPMFAACLQSLIEHTSTAYNYDVILISSDLQPVNRERLQAMVQPYSNISLRVYHPGILLENYHLKANAHISVETYYRFLIQTIVPDYRKVLYIDCDTIIKDDVARLYQTDIEGYMLAAVRDIDFLGQINGANKSTAQYAVEKLHMQNPYNYFQAGVLLFNEEEMRKAYTQDQWLEFASHPYMYNDQDVLNVRCEGHVRYLDMRWNTLTDCDHARIRDVVVYTPDAVRQEYQQARQNPAIIHYAGFMKPWYRPSEDMGDEFWQYSRKTVYYEELIYRMTCRVAGSRTAVDTNEKWRTRFVNRWFPRETARRRTLDWWYVRLFRN